jgi:hypothetical protein
MCGRTETPDGEKHRSRDHPWRYLAMVSLRIVEVGVALRCAVPPSNGIFFAFLCVLRVFAVKMVLAGRRPVYSR